MVQGCFLDALIMSGREEIGQLHNVNAAGAA